MASISDADKLLLARAEDTIRLCDRRSSPCFLGFLDPHERAFLQPWLQKQAGMKFHFYGGFAEAERTLLGVFPEYMDIGEDLFPLQILAFTYRSERALTHRDFLGTLMSAAGVHRRYSLRRGAERSVPARGDCSLRDGASDKDWRRGCALFTGFLRGAACRASVSPIS